MASTITNYSLSINTQYPVPGQDNDTQGFRDNFGRIQQSLTVAAEEITDLQVTNIGIINKLNTITNPVNFDGEYITATNIASVSLVNSGTITTGVLTSYGNISTNGKFIGDGSLLTNIPINNVTSIGTLTNLNVNLNMNVGVAVISTANNYLNVSGVNQLYFADHGYQVVPKYYNTSTNSNSLTINYRNGKYQAITIDTTDKSLTKLQITNWPTSGNFSPILLEVSFIGTSTFSVNTEFRTSCTTYGSVSTTVSIDDWLGNNYLGTAGLLKGYGVYTTSTITSSTSALTHIDKIVDNKTITVFPGYNFVKGTTYYFAPDSSDATRLYQVELSPSVGQTLKLEQSLEAISTYNISNKVVYHLYSYDGGTTIFLRQQDVYLN